MKSFAFRFPIAWKLILMTTVLLLLATIPITMRSSSNFQKFSGQREEEINRSQARARVSEIEAALRTLIDKAQLVGTILYRNTTTEAEREKALDFAFRQDRDLVNVEVYSIEGNKTHLVRRITNEPYLSQYDLRPEFIENLRLAKPFPIAATLAGEIEIRNSTMEGGAPLVTIGLPFVKDDLGTITHVVLADIRLDRIQKVFSEVRERTIYLLDKTGHVLAHPDEKLALTGRSLETLPIVHEAVTAKILEGQKKFEDPESHETYVGAYAKSALGVIVISQILEDVILEPSRLLKKEAFGIAGMILSAALFFVFFVSLRLTSPLEILVKTTKAIAKGDFNVKANVHTSDEVGELATAFDQMTEGLKERDRVKTMFGKLHGTGIANKLLSGDMGLGGEQKMATVFFSDIRDFTAFSESVTAQEVVEMLNEYFKVMVAIINKNHGVVDKFIGDAIMAVWGAPESHGNDAANAVRAALEMRMALNELNETRKARGLKPLKIGMGLHSGQLIAGTIGSDDRMEYTVIGDTVNMASRIEASTKACGTDCLLSDVTSELVKEFFSVDFADSVEVKGKSEPLKLFKVTGYYNESGEVVKVETPYSSYKAEKTDKIKTSSDKKKIVAQNEAPAPHGGDSVILPPPSGGLSEKTLVDPLLEQAAGIELPPVPPTDDDGGSGEVA